MTTRLISVAALAAVAAFAVGCSAPLVPGGDAPPTAPTSTGVSDEFLGEASVVIADGRHPVIIKAVDAATRQITFDLVVFLTGDAADAERQRRLPGTAAGGPNSYLVVNDNPKLRTLAVSNAVELKLMPEDGSVEPAPETLAELAASKVERLCWITVTGGSIVLIEEQAIP